MSSSPLPNGDQPGAEQAYAVIENFFENTHLHEAKQMLSEIREQLLNKSYSHLPGSIPYENTTFFMEKIEKLIQAAHYLLLNKESC